MKRILLTCICLYMFVANAQLNNRSFLKVGNAEKKVYLKSWKIDIKIVGNLAVTTQVFEFFNPNNSILEGSFNFPLNEGQTVTGYALDINGVMRDGVIVGKEKARKTFEKIVRRNTDPGLLEMTEGNNFRSRIYPIPAQKSRTIRITYEQELNYVNSGYQYFLPLSIRDTIPDFSINVCVVSNAKAPEWIENPFTDFVFQKQSINFIAQSKFVNYAPNGNITFIIPFEKNQDNLFVEADSSLKDTTTYFYYIERQSYNNNTKKAPNGISIFWDVSTSRKQADFLKEITFLNLYLKQVKNCQVKLICFSNSILSNDNFEINDGNTQQLNKKLLSLNYDGATQYGVLDLSNEITSNEVFFFTDGISNFGNVKFPSYPDYIPIYTVNSSVVANHQLLNAIAFRTHAKYINLLNVSEEDAVSYLSSISPEVTSIEVVKGSVTELYPAAPFKVRDEIKISGKIQSDSAVLKLNINNGNITTSKILTVYKNSNQAEFIKKVWAQKKLNALLSVYPQNESQITEHGLKYGLVTPFTSLIVLETLEDYLRYEITPPKEMQEEYFAEITKREQQAINEKKSDSDFIKEQLDNAFDDLSERLNWWNTKFPIKKPKPVKNTPSINVAPTTYNTTISQTYQSIVTKDSAINQVYTVSLNSSDTIHARVIHGIVKDKSGEALIGVNVSAKGIPIGTVTDFDGNYELTIPKSITALVFSYVGYENIEKPLISQTINVVLSESGNTLEECVVTALAIKREYRSITYSTQTMVSEEYYYSPSSFAAHMGKVAGVQIISASSDKNTQNRIVIRGESSLSGNSNTLIVIDGVPVNNYLTTTGEVISDFGNRGYDLSPDDVKKVDVLDASSAIALYGSRAANGVILISTKQSKNNNQFIYNDNQTDSLQIIDSSRNKQNNFLYILNDSLVTYAYLKKCKLKILKLSVESIAYAKTFFGIVPENIIGVIKITTSLKKNRNTIEYLDTQDKIDAFINQLKNTEYEMQYPTYLNTKETNATNFSFYIDVADYFYKTNRKKIALRILSNIAEIDLEDHELLRILAYKLEEWGEANLALSIYEKILKIKGEEPQSHRDYALALAKCGKKQEALDLLYGILQKKWEESEARFEGIEGIIISEINQMIAEDTLSKLNIDSIDSRFIKFMPVDLRVVIDWNADEIDMDLHVKEPTKEECYYSNNETESGGRISNDFTDGYGPEEYLIKKAPNGNYNISVDYYNDRVQKEKMPSVVKVTVFRNYGSAAMQYETKVIRLKKEDDDIEVFKVKW